MKKELDDLLQGAAGVGHILLNLVFPNGCGACGCELEEGHTGLCAACRDTLPRLKAPYCRLCSEPFEGEIENPFDCANCGTRRMAFEFAAPACLSRGEVREMIHRFKYNGEHHLRTILGELLLEATRDERFAGKEFQGIVPVPMHPSRKRQRRYNQAHELADFLSRATGKPLITSLIRVRNTGTQTALDRRSRMENLRNAFRLRQNTRMRGMDLLLVDDVFTTGSTADACARVLLEGGARSVRVATVARG